VYFSFTRMILMWCRCHLSCHKELDKNDLEC